MPASARAAVGAKTTISFKTSSVDVDVRRITIPEEVRKAILTTHLTTSGYSDTFIPTVYSDPGQIDFEYNYDPDNTIPFGNPETIEITFVSGAVIRVGGFAIKRGGANVENESLMVGKATIKVTGAITVVAGASSTTAAPTTAAPTT